MSIKLDEKTKIALRFLSKRNGSYHSLCIGQNITTNAMQIASFNRLSVWGDNFTRIIKWFLEINRALNYPYGTLTDVMLKRYEKISRKRSISPQKCVFEMLKDFKKEDLPLALDNEYVKQFLLQKE